MQVFWLFCTKSLMTVSQSMGSSKSRRAEDDSRSVYGYLGTSLSGRVSHQVVVFSRKSWLAYQVLFCVVALLETGATTTTTEKAIDLGSKTKNSQSAWYLAEFLCSHCTTKLTWQPWPVWQCDHLWLLLNIYDRRSVKADRFFHKYLYRDSSVSIVLPHVKESKTVLDSGFHAVDSGFQVLDSSFCQWNLDSGFQSLVGFQNPWAVFQIPKPRIPDRKSKNSRISESGFRGANRWFFFTSRYWMIFGCASVSLNYKTTQKKSRHSMQWPLGTDHRQRKGKGTTPMLKQFHVKIKKCCSPVMVESSK